jgi:phosphoribosyl-dephospho-CoA transferase
VTMPVHSLLRIVPAALSGAQAPGWVAARLGQAPWVVVRRERARAGMIAVGVRGGTRAERFAAWLAAGAVLECLTPLELAARRGWKDRPRRAPPAALACLEQVESILQRHGFGRSWGPSGSVAFELASALPTVGAASDLDLIVRAVQRLSAAAATALWSELSRLPVHADVLLETAQGAVLLAEYARAAGPFLVRTPEGPRLSDDPWASEATAA